MAWTKQARERYKHSPEWYVKYRRNYYKKNKATILAVNAANREKLHAVMRQEKDKPCMDCGGRFHHSAMDFDHVRGKKEFCVAHLNGSIERLLKEIAKCELVCSNCHRVRTWNRRHA